MKQIAVLTSLVLVSMISASSVLAQKETYDVVSYSIPKGWKKEVKENGVQIYTGNEKTGEYCLALIIKSTATDASAGDNFTAMWEKLVKGTVSVGEAPVMNDPSNEKGWDLVSGQAHYTDGANKGLVTLITATGNGKLATMVLMANTDKYQQELQGFVRSVELSKTEPVQGSNNAPATGEIPAPSSIAGIWESSISETNGMGYANGSPMVTSGYFRHAYTFRPDGTYLFLEKDFSVYSKEIFFAWETGTWAINGNRLTITPARGKNESWSKSASGNTKEWGSLQKTTERKLEKITYSFELHYYSGMNQTYLDLKYNKPTERDGRQSNDNNKENLWSYKPPYTPGQSSIDLPPGKKIETLSAGTSSKAEPPPVYGNNAALAGKVWEGSSKEKFVGGTMNGYNTGGFFTYQYKFRADGTYRFVYVGASAYTETNSLQYESGTYSVNGNQLTILPSGGNNEEWSVVGGPVKLSAMNDVQIDKIKRSWGKRVKTGKRN
ncbi:MAG: lipocalin family protein, partial [Bacteroidetes bacterium]|nr:lipocalin family protein [Bacteroidota bacterium]